MTRYLIFEVITDDRFKKLSEHEKAIECVKSELEPICEYSASAPREYTFTYNDVENKQLRTKFVIIKKNKGVTWNDVYKAVNKTYAPFYKFVNSLCAAL